MSAALQVRNLREAEIPQIIAMAAQEGWNPGRHDASAFFKADQQGFFVAEANGEPVAYISAVNYDGAYGFVGLYIVDPAHRGKGYGIAIWQHALARLDGIPCGLDGVPAQVENYKKSGFVYAFRQMRLAAPAMAGGLRSYSSVERLTLANAGPIVQYDATVFGAPRHTFIQAWLAMPNAQTFCVREGDRLLGYAVIRECIDGYKIGPLFADDEAVAEELFLACHGAMPSGVMVYIDMPEINPVTSTWIARYPLELVFETARMYRGRASAFPLEKVFGVTTFELG